MKILNIALLVGFACCLTLTGCIYYSWQNSTPRVAYIDTDKLLNSYQAMVTARNQYQREKQEWEHNLTILREEAQKATIQSQQRNKLNTPAEKINQARDAKLKQEQFLNYQQAVLKQEPQEMARLTQPVIASVNHYIALYSQKHQYNLVLTAAGQGDVVYSDKKMDITADVIKQLNQHLTDSLAATRKSLTIK